MFFPPYGDTIAPMPAISVLGKLVDVVNGQIYPACVNLLEGKIGRVERKVSVPQRYILPGLIDAHVHLDSTMLTPYRFAEQAVPHGTTAVIASVFRLANVMGVDGIRYMMADARNSPLRLFLTAPPCVPPTGDPRPGPEIDWRDIRDLLSLYDVAALGEVINYEDVLNDDPNIMSKLEVAMLASKPVDGHCPGLSGRSLTQYIRSGVSTDHECSTGNEAKEKDELGMTIMVREGTSHDDIKALWPFPKDNKHLLVSNHLSPTDLMKGHMDEILRKAVAAGIDPMHAIRAMTIWPAEHYNLPTGYVDLGMPGDLVVVDNLKDFNVQEVYIHGKLMAKSGTSLFLGNPTTAPPFLVAQQLKAEDFLIPYHEATAIVPVVDVTPDSEGPLVQNEQLLVVDGKIRPDPSRDILLFASVDRFVSALPLVGFIRGFKLKKGAMASTATKDPRDIIAVGADPYAMAVAVNSVSLKGGYFATDGANSVSLELPVAGLMSPVPCQEVAIREKELLLFINSMGCDLPYPFDALSTRGRARQGIGSRSS